MYEFSVLKLVYLGDVWGWLGFYLDNGKVFGLNFLEGFIRIRDKNIFYSIINIGYFVFVYCNVCFLCSL